MRLGLAVLAFVTPWAGSALAEAAPGRVDEAPGVSWLRFGLEHRSRFEHLDSDFRRAHSGDATGWFTRTLLFTEVRFRPLVVGLEIEDSRAWTSETTPLNTTLVDPLEVLQGYVGLRSENTFARGDSASLTVGRMTLDLGSRRLVARNEFRNTINGFTGVDALWTSPERDVVHMFAVMPVVRQPSETEGLEDNRVELDRENTDTLFWGTFIQSRPLAAQVTLEAYLLGLHEADNGRAPSSNRRLYTPGLRALKPPGRGELDFQLEVTGQFGRSRASSAATDTTDLAHLALAFHASSGYRFELPWAPRVLLQYDYASGDHAPDDGENNRFDPLFGARRFELGPTGLYGAVARSNLVSPGLRIEVQPHRTLDAVAAHRLVWLASTRDAWTTAGLRDPTGDSGRFVGQQLEGRVRWHLWPRHLVFEGGSALFTRGDFARRAPNGTATPSVHLYSQATAKF